jgi:hypothetical protein
MRHPAGAMPAEAGDDAVAAEWMNVEEGMQADHFSPTTFRFCGISGWCRKAVATAIDKFALSISDERARRPGQYRTATICGPRHSPSVASPAVVHAYASQGTFRPRRIKAKGRADMDSSNTLYQQGHRLLQIGVALFLFTSFEGFAVPYFAVPNLGRSVHTLSAFSGVMLVALGLLGRGWISELRRHGSRSGF